METLSIKVKIGAREYPMKVHPSEEALLRRGAQRLQEAFRQYQARYPHNDVQDLLAMLAFDYMIEKVRQGMQEKEGERLLIAHFKRVEALFNEVLKK